MSKYDALFEDEENIFGGTPKSKYWDIALQASDDLVKDEFDKVIQKFAAMEALLRESYSDDELQKKIEQYCFENSMEIEEHKKSLYIEFTGEIVCRLDS
jgi:phage host-nuclease inhibitor protein Gam